MGRRIWVIVDMKDGSQPFAFDCRVNSFGKFLPAGPVAEGEPSAKDSVRRKHLVKLLTDPGGTRVLTVGSIRLKRPRGILGAEPAERQVSSDA